MGKKNLPIFKIPYLILFTIFILIPIHSAFAETKTFIKEYTYHAGDEDSRNSSRTIALREVKRLLLEELGTYLESQTEVKNFQMTKDQITTLTAGIVSTEVIEDTWDGKVYWLKAKIAANPQDVIKSIDSLVKNRKKVKELEEFRKKSEELLRENERLNKELKIAKGEKKQEAEQAYKRNIDNLSAAEWFERGFGLVISGNHTDAVKAFNKAIELNPQDAQAYNIRGITYGILGNYQQEIKDFDKAIELNPRDAQAYYNRGVSYSNLGNRLQAIKDYNRAIERNPQDAKTYYNRGISYHELGNYKQAIKDFDKAIELNPQYTIAYNNRGVSYNEIGNHQAAIKDFDKAIELNPKNTIAHNNRGATNIKRGNYQAAINDFDRIIELDPSDAETYNIRGSAYVKLGDYQAAIKDFKTAARLGRKLTQDFLRSQGIEW